MAKSNGSKPVAKFRIGYVTASVWKNDGAKDQTFFNVTLQRSYKDGDDWKNSDSLGHGDLLNAARALQRAEDYIAKQE